MSHKPAWLVCLWRPLATLFALCFVAAYASALLHFLVIRHSVCSQHGHWIHAGESHALSAGTASSTAKFAAKPERPHSHCDLTARISHDEAVEFTRPSLLLHTPQSDAVLCITAHASATSSVATLLMAPKQSPPLA